MIGWGETCRHPTSSVGNNTKTFFIQDYWTEKHAAVVQIIRLVILLCLWRKSGELSCCSYRKACSLSWCSGYTDFQVSSHALVLSSLRIVQCKRITVCSRSYNGFCTIKQEAHILGVLSACFLWAQRSIDRDGSHVRYHCGGWPEEVNTCFLNSDMVYL